MRYALLLLVLAQASSCSNVTRPSASPDYLRCPSAMQTGSPVDTGLTNIDSSLFGSQTKSSPYNCNSDPTLCNALGADFVCDTRQGCCQEAPPGYCVTTSDCADPAKPVCNQDARVCIPCATGAMQADGNQQCQVWVTAHADPLSRNLCVSGLCAECLTNADCKRPGKSFCDQMSNICGGCTQNSDCPASNICKRDLSLLATGDDLTKIGDCADASLVAYVDRAYINCSNGDGSAAKPVCQISDALALPKTPSYINVVGHGNAMVQVYDQISVGTSGQRVAIIGPGRDVAFTTAQAVVDGISVTNGAQVTLQNLAVTSHHSSPAVMCDTSSTLYVSDVIINDYAMPPKGGIYANNCSKVTVEKTKIAYAGGYSVFIVGGSGHRVINNAFIDGGSVTESAGMRLGGGATGLFSFNTIANNRQGIVCDSVVPVTDSIVTMNGAGMQVSTTCTQQRIVTTGIALDPSYMNNPQAGDPKLTADNANQCIDQGMPDANKTIKEDYFGSMRPQGNGYDVGFQEVR